MERVEADETKSSHMTNGRWNKHEILHILIAVINQQRDNYLYSADGTLEMAEEMKRKVYHSLSLN